MYTRKKSKAKIYLAIILLVILAVAGGITALVYSSNGPKPVTVGVKLGDTFTYSIKGTASLINETATIPDYFNQYNETEYYKITVTAVNGTNVTLDTAWRFKNGTEVNTPQTLDLSTGQKSDENGFWALYAANLNPGDLIRPNGHDEQAVNKTDTKAYADSTRIRNFWFIGNEFFDVTDPSHNSRRYEYVQVYFDKETGMVDTLVNLQSYNTPEREFIITWRLIDSSLWKV